MSEQSVFNRNTVEMNTVPQPQGLLEQLNLPPALITFLRAHQKAVWAVISVVIVVVVTVSLYGSYRTYKLDQAASALDIAKRSGDSAISNLKQVVDEYGSTPAAMWAKVEMVSLHERAGELESAVSVLQQLNGEASTPPQLKPLITYKLASLFERQDAYEKALGMYTVLSQMKGFEAEAFKAMGRVNEQLGKNDQAIAMYKKYLEQLEATADKEQSDPSRTVIEARLNTLEEK